MDDWKLFLVFFKNIFFTFRGFWRVGSNLVSRAIAEKYHKDIEYCKKNFNFFSEKSS